MEAAEVCVVLINCIDMYLLIETCVSLYESEEKGLPRTDRRWPSEMGVA